MRFLIIIFAFVSINLNGQTDTASTFFKRLYFPFSFGYGLSQNTNTHSGIAVITGFEYRLRKSDGLFFRFNFDSRKHQYKIVANPANNVADGKLEFSDYLIGIGNRFGNNKLKLFGLIQGGLSSYKHLFISGPENNYKISEHINQAFAFKTTVGAEYSLSSDAALTFETGYTIIPGYSEFWNNHLRIFEITLGLTTTLF
jgi:hypothetical protein